MRAKRGFTLIEIIVVLVIVGVLATIAVPNFVNMINQSYAQDAMRNLMAIYAAQVSNQQNSGSYCTASCANTGSINSNLGVSIVTSGGTGYNCNVICTGGTQCCIAAGQGSFTMQLVLSNPVNVGTAPVYCGPANPPPTNPCCQGGNAGDTCP
ncbi:MAG: prepilin-type N-terminal cleavage/methylation domain-containing protein [Candidatus Omnitrophica bacterium]|nr:prepilin-type N-terminal cleavage/methylation domain-containing protein [Candidatus Omnitrophota bacterium]